MSVYLIATPTIDRRGRSPNLEPAGRHGDLKRVLDSGDIPCSDPFKCLDKIYRKLENFDPDRDHLLWAGGDTLAAVMAGCVLSDFGVENISWLRFDRGRDPLTGERDNERGIYVPIRVPIFLPEME